MSAIIHTLANVSRLKQFMKFCLVGGSGVVVDMLALHFLVSPGWLSWNLTLSKIIAAEVAMLNNFAWNDSWTFRNAIGDRSRLAVVAHRLWRFHAICGIGIVLAVLFLHMFHTWLGFNLYVANLLAIFLVTFWNFWMNASFNWRVKAQKDN